MIPFNITLKPSERSFQNEPGQTLLASALEAGIPLPYGCKDGACGSCKCKLLEGEVTHGPNQVKALSAQEEQEGYVLTCCATAQSDLVLQVKQVMEVGLPPIKKMPVRVASFQRLASDVMLIKLQLPASDSFEYLPGQYIDFLLKDGQKRSYSIANAMPLLLNHENLSAPTQFIELHIRHLPGGLFTEHVFGKLKEKEILRIEGPMGSFFLRKNNKPILFLASGTGFAPIKALIESIELEQAQQRLNPSDPNTPFVPREMSLYWGGRDAQDLYMMEWIHEAQKRIPHLHFVPVLSEPSASTQWSGRTGFVHLAALEDHPDMRDMEVYACGAPIVIESARRDFTQMAHLPEEAFYADAFTSEADKHTSN